MSSIPFDSPPNPPSITDIEGSIPKPGDVCYFVYENKLCRSIISKIIDDKVWLYFEGNLKQPYVIQKSVFKTSAVLGSVLDGK